ncbi:MAG: NAD-dependent epimerase/dehydratase family protein, partial [Verrucomicrobia bacterium]|nr:NAD-dependent epimerase/dehydratase family protein [Verrucomicrobiota bacterium]
MEKKRVLVTGAAGFIGFHAARALAKCGHQVLGVDNFNSYYEVALKKERAQQLLEEGVEVIEGDLAQENALPPLFDRFAPTHLLHLAAQAGVRHCLEAPQEFGRDNLLAFLNLLEVCRKYPQVPLIFASSSSVYGLNKTFPFSEKDTTERPSNLYGATKKSNELLAHAYHNCFGIPVTALRFFTVYGPWGRPDMAVYRFARQIARGEPVTLYGQGNMRRDFTYIDDIVAGIVASIDLQAPWEIFNLGSHQSEELMTLIRLLEQHLGKKALIKHIPTPQGEVDATFADIS